MPMDSKPIIEINGPSKPIRTIKITPKPGKFYFIDYIDADQPEGNYFGIAQCTKVCDINEMGEKITPPLYEFLHPTKDGEQTLSLFYASEVLMEV